MGTYNKNIPQPNKKGRKLFHPTHDKQTKQDDESGLWIKSRKRTYLYWYKFLQVCLQKKLTIKKEKYRGWDLDTILDTKFDVWWKTHWKKLFGVKERTDTPKFSTSSKTKLESIRMSYLVYHYDRLGKYANLEIGYRIVKREIMMRYLTRSNDSWFPIKNGLPIHLKELKKKLEYIPKLGVNNINEMKKIKKKNLHNKNTVKRIIQEIARHKMKYKKIIKNVCNGVFP